MKEKSKKSVYLSLGKTGMNLILKKQSIRKGKTSKVSPGHEMTITLSDPIKVGNGISQIVKNDSTNQNLEPIAKKEFVTTKVTGMQSLMDGVSFKIKTETSNYLATFIL